VQPVRDDVVVCVEGLFTWSWLADLCEDAGVPCVLGHALSVRAIHGGQAKNDRLGSHTIAGCAPRAISGAAAIIVCPSGRGCTRICSILPVSRTSAPPGAASPCPRTATASFLPQIEREWRAFKIFWV
jgi:hypothetical protein